MPCIMTCRVPTCLLPYGHGVAMSWKMNPRVDPKSRRWNIVVANRDHEKERAT